MSSSPRILLIDAQPIVLAGCQAVLSSISDIDVAHARTARTGFEYFCRLKPDVTILDLNLPDDPGLRLAKRILTADCSARIIALTASEATILALQAIDSGILGFVSKFDEAQSLTEAVTSALKGKQWISGALVQEMALARAERNASILNLNDKEMAVLQSLVGGLSLAEIAKELDLSYKTTASYCVSLRKKFKARTTSELVRIAIHMHLA